MGVDTGIKWKYLGGHILDTCIFFVLKIVHFIDEYFYVGCELNC